MHAPGKHTYLLPPLKFPSYLLGVIEHEVNLLLINGVAADAGDRVKVVVLVAVQKPESGRRARHRAITPTIHLHQTCTVHLARDHNYDCINPHWDSPQAQHRNCLLTSLAIRIARMH